MAAPLGIYDASCLFCRIIRAELPCAKVYEDETVLAFLDIHPIAKGHTLVVPKAHAPTLFDVSPAIAGPLFAAMQQVGKAIMEVTGATGINCVQNNFSDAGQVIFHAHWHLVPRFPGDGLLQVPSGSYDSADAMQALAGELQKRCLS